MTNPYEIRLIISPGGEGYSANWVESDGQPSNPFPLPLTQANAKDLRTEAGYFRTHQRRIPYLEIREEGYPSGSGMVESEAKQFKARFCGPGMRRSREGAQRLIPIRATIMSQQFLMLFGLLFITRPQTEMLVP